MLFKWSLSLLISFNNKLYSSIKLFDSLFQIYKEDLGNLEIKSINLFSEIYDFMYLIIIKLKFIDENEFRKRILLLFSK